MIVTFASDISKSESDPPKRIAEIRKQEPVDFLNDLLYMIINKTLIYL